jgi:hypothetical protein
MAQPYTARQLDFFKTTLKILESAIFDAELLAGEADALQEIPAVSITTDTTAPVIAHDTQGVSSSYFSAMPDPADAVQSAVISTYLPPLAKITAPPTIATVTTLPSVKNSSTFFQSLPWQNGLPATPTGNKAAVVSDDSPVDAHTAKMLVALDIFDVTPANAKSSTAYFRSLPWKGQSRSPTVITQATTDSLPSAVDTHVSSDTEVVSTVADTIPSIVSSTSPTAAITANNQTVKNTSVGFFRSLPWQGQKQSSDSTDLLTAMESDDFATIANLATQTALQAAQRGNDEHNVNTPLAGRKTASGFFQILPW